MAGPDDLVECRETVRVLYPYSAFDPPKPDKELELECCLMAPHEGFKHLNPRLQLTQGGAHIVVDGWSPWIDKSDAVRCAECGGFEHDKWCSAVVE